jgi:hypothetical protein
VLHFQYCRQYHTDNIAWYCLQPLGFLYAWTVHHSTIIIAKT